MRKKFWNLKQTSTNNAELTLYGTISESSWWGDEVTPQQFADDLKALGDVEEIAVRINSGGGDVFAGLAIHTMLKRHAAKVTIYVDGLAASIASIIAMAGDKVVMPKGSMMMIHNPWTSVWGGDANDFRHTADVLDKIRDSLVSVYADKTQLDADEIKALLDAETWLTAEDAVEKGFADEVEDSTSIAASIKGKTAFVNGIEIDWTKFKNAPKLPVEPSALADEEEPPAEGSEDQPAVPETLTEEILAQKYPTLYASILQKGVTQERARMKAIDDLSLTGFRDLVAKAKYENGHSAEHLAMEVLKAQKNQRQQFLNAVVSDADESGVDDVTPDDPAPETEKEAVQSRAQAIANQINQIRGGRK